LFIHKTRRLTDYVKDIDL